MRKFSWLLLVTLFFSAPSASSANCLEQYFNYVHKNWQPYARAVALIDKKESQSGRRQVSGCLIGGAGLGAAGVGLHNSHHLRVLGGIVGTSLGCLSGMTIAAMSDKKSSELAQAKIIRDEYEGKKDVYFLVFGAEMLLLQQGTASGVILRKAESDLQAFAKKYKWAEEPLGLAQLALRGNNEGKLCSGKTLLSPNQLIEWARSQSTGD